MSLARILARNITANWLGFAVHAITAFLLTPFVLSALGASRYGAWCLLIGLTGYYGLLDLGFRAGLTQYLTRYLSLRDFDRLNQTASTGLFALATVAVAIVAATPVIAFAAPWIFSISGQNAAEARTALLLVGTATAIQLPLFTFASVLFAAQRYDVSNYITVTSRLATAGLTYAALSFEYGLIGMATATVAGNLIDYLLRWKAAYRVVPALRISLSQVRSSALKEFASFSAWNWLIAGSRQLISYTDIVVIGIFLPIAAVAPFGLAASVIEYFNATIAPLAAVFFPVATQLDATGDTASLTRVYLVSSRLILSVALIGGVSAVIWSDDLFRLWIDVKGGAADTSETASLIFRVLGAAAIITSAQRVGYQVMLGTRRVKLLALLLIAEGFANLVVSVALVRSIGSLGVALGTVLPAALFQGAVHPWAVSRLLGISPLATFRAIYTRPLMLAACFIPLALALKSQCPVDTGWGGLLLGGCASGAIGVLLLLAVSLKRSERFEYLWRPAKRFAMASLRVS